jgi:THO complex subunit 7
MNSAIWIVDRSEKIYSLLNLLQVEELQISIEDEQKTIADELRAIAGEQKMSIEEGSGGASDAMAVD